MALAMASKVQTLALALRVKVSALTTSVLLTNDQG